jgi:hypothetical protein
MNENPKFGIRDPKPKWLGEDGVWASGGVGSAFASEGVTS